MIFWEPEFHNRKEIRYPYKKVSAIPDLFAQRTGHDLPEPFPESLVPILKRWLSLEWVVEKSGNLRGRKASQKNHDNAKKMAEDLLKKLKEIQ